MACFFRKSRWDNNEQLFNNERRRLTECVHGQSEMARTQKNKATSYHLGQLKAKLAKLKRELLIPSAGSGGGGGGMLI